MITNIEQGLGISNHEQGMMNYEVKLVLTSKFLVEYWIFFEVLENI